MIETTIIDLITTRLPENADTYPDWTIRCTWTAGSSEEIEGVSFHAAASENSAQGLAQYLVTRYQASASHRLVRAEVRHADGTWRSAQPPAGRVSTPLQLALPPLHTAPTDTRATAPDCGNRSLETREAAGEDHAGGELGAPSGCPTSYARPKMAKAAPSVAALRLDAGRLRGVRIGLALSQEEFAKAIRTTGAALGEPNGCTKRNVQKWESGEVSLPRPNVRRALETVTGIPFLALCTPTLVVESDPAALELSAITASMNDLVCRMAKLCNHLSFSPTPNLSDQ